MRMDDDVITIEGFLNSHVQHYLQLYAPWLDVIGVMRVLSTFTTVRCLDVSATLDPAKTYMLESGSVCVVLNDSIGSVKNVVNKGNVFGAVDRADRIVVVQRCTVWESTTDFFVKAALLSSLMSKCGHAFCRVVEQAFFVTIERRGDTLQDAFVGTEHDVFVSMPSDGTFIVLLGGAATCGDVIMSLGEVCPLSPHSLDKKQGVLTRITALIPQTRFLVAQYTTIENFGPETVTEFHHIETINEGNFGMVELVERFDKNMGMTRRYALKKVRDCLNVTQIKSIERELDALSTARGSPFILRLFGVVHTSPPMLLLEYLPGGNLLYVMENFGDKLSGMDHRYYLLSLAHALAHLHSRLIIFRDIKPENIVLDAAGRLRLVDFGLSKKLETAQELALTLCGTPDYLSPELITGMGASFPNDWWGFGVLGFELATGFTPFSAFGSTNETHDPTELDPGLCRRIVNDPVPLPEDWEDDVLIEFILGLLDKDPRRRPGAEWVLQHAVFAKLDVDDLYKGRLVPPYMPVIR